MNGPTAAPFFLKARLEAANGGVTSAGLRPPQTARQRATRAATTLALVQAEAHRGATRGQCSGARRRNDGYGAPVPSRRRRRRASEERLTGASGGSNYNSLVSDATEDGSKGYLLSHTAPKEKKIA